LNDELGPVDSNAITGYGISRDTAISCAVRRAAKYRFQGTVVSTASHDSAMITAPAVSSVVSGTLTMRPSQTISYQEVVYPCKSGLIGVS
jgi:hypothetical protein